MTGPWMARFLDDFKSFMAKYWVVKPADDEKYWKGMLADFNALVDKYEAHPLVTDMLIAYTTYQEDVCAGRRQREGA